MKNNEPVVDTTHLKGVYNTNQPTKMFLNFPEKFLPENFFENLNQIYFKLFQESAHKYRLEFDYIING